MDTFRLCGHTGTMEQFTVALPQSVLSHVTHRYVVLCGQPWGTAKSIYQRRTHEINMLSQFMRGTGTAGTVLLLQSDYYRSMQLAPTIKQVA